MRNNENITCAVIEDLLPAYAENLCSDETKALIEAHLAGCKSCAALLRGLPLPEQKEAPVPEEKKAFKKLSRKIAKSKTLNRILGGIITVAALVLCVLSLGQIYPNAGIPSFDTVRFSIQTKHLTKQLTGGDIDRFFDSVGVQLGGIDFDSRGFADDIVYFGEPENRNAFYEQFDAECRKRYDAAYGNIKVKKLRSHDVGRYMLNNYNDSLAGCVEVIFEDGRSFNIFYISQGYGEYTCMMNEWSDWGETDNSPEAAFAHCISFRYELNMNFKTMREHLLVREGEMKDVTSRIAFFMFREDLRETVNERVKQFYQHADFAVTDCSYSDLRWDAEKKMLYFVATVNAKDSEGTAVMQTRIYDSYDGWLIPEPGSAEVWEHGCTPELADALRHFFA